MTLTEAEARKRWCPFAQSRVISIGTDQFADHPVLYKSEKVGDIMRPSPLCIGSNCMAWRELLIEDRDGVPLGTCGLASR